MRFKLPVAAAIAAVSLSPLGAAPATATKTTALAQPKGPSPVARAKYITNADAEFARIDADHNKILTKKEAETFEAARLAAAIENRRRALFAALDADHNGSITPQEFARLQLPAPKVNAGPFFTQNDPNQDGQVTLIEYEATKAKFFDRIDADKDGIVTPAEMKAAGLIK